MALLEVVAKLVGTVESLVAVNVRALVPGLDMLPHVTTVVTITTESATATMRAAVALIDVRRLDGDTVRNSRGYWDC